MNSISPLSGGFRPQTTPVPGSSSMSSAVQSILNALSVSSANVTLSTQPGGQTTLQKGLSSLVTLQVSASQSHQLQQLGLVSSQVQLALAIKGSETVATLRKRLKELEEETLFSDRLGDVAAALGMSSHPDALLLVEESGGIVLVDQAIQSVKAHTN